MNVNLNLSRGECIQTIGKVEIEQIVRASIEHFALPIIAGISMDEISQHQYEEMGGRGSKPAPLSDKIKLEIYNRIKNFIKPKILNKTAELVNHVLTQSLAFFSDEELRLKATILTKKVIEAEPNWKNLSSLFKDHTCLFKDLETKSNLKANLISFHDILCPIMSGYSDSGELYSRIKLEDLLR